MLHDRRADFVLRQDPEVNRLRDGDLHVGILLLEKIARRFLMEGVYRREQEAFSGGNVAGASAPRPCQPAHPQVAWVGRQPG
jgi:hypothetical protein